MERVTRVHASRSRRRPFLAGLLAVLAAACGGGEPTGPPDTPRTTVLRDTTISDATYCTVEGVDLEADLFFPGEEVGPSAPAALFVHGGGWVSGSKEGSPALEMLRGPLLEEGFVVASVEYRLAPEHQWPAQIEDVKCAVRSLRASADSFGIDEDRVGVWGPSAGGHLAAMLGATDPSSGFGGAGGHQDRSSRVQAVIDLFGPADLTTDDWFDDQRTVLETVFGTSDQGSDIARNASPVTHVSSDDPPFLIIHGREDSIVPLTQSQSLHGRLQDAGVASTLIVVENAGHGLFPAGGTPSPGPDELVRRALDFLREHLGG